MPGKESATSGVALAAHSRIWDRAEHNAFTDLLRHGGSWYCVFREARDHAGSLGAIRVLLSPDAKIWSSAARVSQRNVDLRDPKLSVTPDGRLMLLLGWTEHRDGAIAGRQSRVLFSRDGHTWTRPRKILEPGDWLWRVTWHAGRAYGVTYRLVHAKRWDIHLAASTDGLDWHLICRLGVTGKPNETTVRFDPAGMAVALVRREGGDRRAWIGRSPAPYRAWTWTPTRHRIGGPNFLVLPDGRMWASGRAYRRDTYRTVIARMDPRAYRPVLDLPSGGDCSYPGMVWHRGLLWVSYYSSHEGKCAIYLAAVRPRGRKPGGR